MLIIQPRWHLRVKRELSSMIIPHQCFNNSNLLTMPRCYPVVRLCACKNKNNRPNITQLPLPTKLRTSIMSVHPWFKARIQAIKFWILTRALRAWPGVVLRKMRLIILWPELNPRKISNRCLKVAVVNSNNSQPTWKSISLKKNWWYWKISTTLAGLLVISNSYQNNLTLKAMHSQKFFIFKTSSFKTCSSISQVWLSIRIRKPMVKTLKMLKGNK